MSHGLSGGHSETLGITPAGEVVEIALHDHDVELDLTRFELGISRTLTEEWDVALRVPYLIIDQTAGVSFRQPPSAADLDAATRNGRNHHRTETYEGFGDLELAFGWRATNLSWLGENSVFRFSIGTTLPIGDTEEDPWLLGDNGQEHLHVQLGNGTFDPLLDLYVGAPITDTFAWNFYCKARLPFYRNSKGYRGPVEALASPRLTWLPNKLTSVSAGVTGIYSGYSSWKESGRDRNSGQFSVLGGLSVGRKLNNSLTASLSALIPIYNETFSSEDALDPAPTFSLSFGYSF